MMLESRISAVLAVGAAWDMARRELARAVGAGGGIFFREFVDWESDEGAGSAEPPGRKESAVGSWSGS